MLAKRRRNRQASESGFDIDSFRSNCLRQGWGTGHGERTSWQWSELTATVQDWKASSDPTAPLRTWDDEAARRGLSSLVIFSIKWQYNCFACLNAGAGPRRPCGAPLCSHSTPRPSPLGPAPCPTLQWEGGARIPLGAQRGRLRADHPALWPSLTHRLTHLSERSAFPIKWATFKKQKKTPHIKQHGTQYLQIS